VGKTTIVRALATGLESHGRRVRVLSTDAFLLPNAVLNERGLLMRKGFPESYDDAAIRAALGRLRAGRSADVPVYSHDAYDIVAGTCETITAADVVLIEGIVALQSPTVDHLDLAVYVDAAEPCVRDWFIERFARLTAAAADDASSFYHPLADAARQLPSTRGGDRMASTLPTTSTSRRPRPANIVVGNRRPLDRRAAHRNSVVEKAGQSCGSFDTTDAARGDAGGSVSSVERSQA
jgi:hypothetical protein